MSKSTKGFMGMKGDSLSKHSPMKVGGMSQGSKGQITTTPGQRPKVSAAIGTESPSPAPFTVGYTDMSHLDKAAKPNRQLGFGGAGGPKGPKAGRPGRMLSGSDTMPDEL